jgi:transglutaminase-like putative cysteine protease
MVRVSRLLCLALSLLSSSVLWAADWTKPTPEELSMTSQPEVPGAAAVYLYRQEATHDMSQAANDANSDSHREGFCSTVEPDPKINTPQPQLLPKLNYQTLYVRLKILTVEGERYGNVVIDEAEPYFSTVKVEGRTIRPDGSIVPLEGVVDHRLISKTRDMLRYRTSFQMSAVHPGSILEYRVTVRYPEAGGSQDYQVASSGSIAGQKASNDSPTYAGSLFFESPPQWYVQQDLFVRKSDYFYGPHTWVRRASESNFGYSSTLPAGINVVYNQSERSYTLHAENILPVTPTELAPPWRSQGYRVIFHHTCFPSVTEFWTAHGKWWTGDVDRFASVSSLKSIAAGLVASSDTEQQKADKLYAAGASVRNLSFGVSTTADADEKTELRLGNAREVWERKQGSSQDITMLFVGLARAAGLKAYVMAVGDRSRDIFDPNDVREEDINDYLAIVNIDGKEQFFDPGAPFCAPAQLSWKHAFVSGVRQSDGGLIFAQTPAGGNFKQNQTIRSAKLQIAKDGGVTGAVTLSLSGSPAVDWRQSALWNPEGFNDAIAAELGASLPAGLTVKTIKVTGLAEPVISASAPPLLVQMELTGQLPASASGEIAVPGSLFEAQAPQLFTAEKRDAPVDMRYPSVSQDVVTLTPPAGAKARSVPADATVPLGDSARLVVKHSAEADHYTVVRMMIQGKTFYGFSRAALCVDADCRQGRVRPTDATSEYSDVKAFYSKVSAQDAETIVFAPAP